MTMTGDEYRTYLDVIASAARTLLLVPTDQLLAANSTADTLGAVLDPTAYRAGMHNLEDQRRLIAAAHEFRRIATDLIASRERT